jgi:hypothetical protein
MRTLLREPLLHFLVLAGMLFALNSFWSERRKPLVEITAAAVQAQARVSEQRLRRPLSAADIDRLTQEMLQQEILFQEAQRRGMVADNQVRGTLISMMRTALKPVTAAPDDAALLALRDELPREATTLPEQLSFEHVSFTTPDKVPPDLLAKLRAGASSSSLGETIRLANPLPPTYRPQLDSLLGTDFVARLVRLPLNKWHGPLTSTRGIHFVRLISRSAEQSLPMDQLRPLLESHWLKSHEADAVAREVAKLKEDYRILLPKRSSATEAAK